MRPLFSVLFPLLLLLGMWLLIRALASRRGEPLITLAQRVIRTLYRAAAWLEDLAIAADRGYLAYRMERSLNEIEPENERWNAPIAAQEVQP